MMLVKESRLGENHLPDPWTIMEAARSTRMWKKKGSFYHINPAKCFIPRFEEHLGRCRFDPGRICGPNGIAKAILQIIARGPQIRKVF